MRRIATLSLLAAALSATPLLSAAAGDGCCRHGRHGYRHAPPVAFFVAPVSPYADWRAYYEDQAELSFARRTARANAYVATGRAIPSRYLGPPTNYYAEQYALDPYTYFACPLARRGEGVCLSQPPLSAVPVGGQ
jgi:hypothetical protein